MGLPNFLTGATPEAHAKFAADAQKAGHTTIHFLKKKSAKKKMTAKQAALVKAAMAKKKAPVMPMALTGSDGDGDEA